MLKKTKVLAALAACAVLGSTHAESTYATNITSQSASFSSMLGSRSVTVGNDPAGAVAQLDVPIDVDTGPVHGIHRQTVGFLVSSVNQQLDIAVNHAFDMFGNPTFPADAQLNAMASTSEILTNTTDSARTFWLASLTRPIRPTPLIPTISVTSNGVAAPIDTPPQAVTNDPYPVHLLGQLGAGQSASITVSMSVSQSLSNSLPTDFATTVLPSVAWFFVSNPVSPVPEPSTVAMMVAGVAGIGLASKRKKA